MSGLIKFLVTLFPFIKELIFKKDLGATKGGWRRVMRFSMIISVVITCMLVICLVHIVDQAARIRELTKADKELRVICDRPVEGNHYYDYFK